MPLNAQRKPVDKLYLVGPVLDVILRQIEVNYVPYQDLSIDEAMTFNPLSPGGFSFHGQKH